MLQVGGGGAREDGNAEGPTGQGKLPTAAFLDQSGLCRSAVLQQAVGALPIWIAASQILGFVVCPHPVQAAAGWPLAIFVLHCVHCQGLLKISVTGKL